MMFCFKGSKQLRYLYDTYGEPRLSDETLLSMKESEISNKHVFGIKGITSLIQIPNFEIDKCVPIDFMHNICLGVVKYMADVWFDTKNNKMEFYLGLKVKKIDKRILQFNTYSEISRYPREISQRNQWKANEWLNWLLYYANPSLMEFLPRQHFKHFQKLRKVIRMLLGDNLTDQNLDNCAKKLQHFVKKFQDLYGQKYMVYNIHLLLHLVESVRNFGPLWGFSLFPYENMNGFLKNFVKGPKDPLTQINTKYLVYHDLNFKKYSEQCRSEIQEFCEAMIHSGCQSNTIISCMFNCYFLPNPIIYSVYLY